MKTFTSFQFAYLLLLVSLGFMQSLSAQKVAPAQAKIVARNYYYQENTSLTNRGQVRITDFQALKYEGETVIYAVQLNEKGFVLVANAQEVSPILAYSNEGSDIKNMNPQAEAYLLPYKQQLAAIRKYANQVTPEMRGTSTQKWEILSDENYERTNNTAKIMNGGNNGGGMSTMSVAPLLTCNWNQNMPYGTFCPDSSGVKCAVGCVAVAMAQIMDFHKHPSIGSGSRSYSSDYRNESANFGTTNYHITTLPDSLKGANASNLDVPKLLYHCGVSVDMDYQPSGSSAYVNNWFYVDAEDAFEDNFGYHSNGNTSSGSGYVSYIQSELNNGRPLLMSGSGSQGGHAWVCDGYSGSLLHMNWGWGGKSNGNFIVGSLFPVGGPLGFFDFNSSNEVLSVQPLLSDITPVASVSPSAVNQGTSVTVSSVLYNLGGFRNAPTTLKYYASTDNTFDVSDNYLGSSSVPILEVLGPVSITKTVTLSNNYIGNVYVLVIADATNEVRESNESNNTFAAPVTINYCNLGFANLNIYGTIYSTPVSVSSNVNWSATSNAAWISIGSGSGSNNGTFYLNIPSNPNATSRSGIVTVNANGMTRTINVTQGAAPLLTVSPAAITTHHGGHSASTNLTTTVPLTLSSNAAWLTGPANIAAGSTSFTYTVQTNPNTTSRVGILTFSGYGQSKTITITQLGKNDEPCNAITLPVCLSNLCAINYTSNTGATATSTIPNTACTLLNNDVWYKFVVPASGSFTISTYLGQTSPAMTDGVMAAYIATSCSTMTLIACNDDYNGNLMPKIVKQGYTAGATIYVRISGYSISNAGEFGIAVTNTYSPIVAPGTGSENEQAQQMKKANESAALGKDLALSIFPNPADAQLNIQFSTEEADKFIFTLTDINGKIVWENTKEMQVGQQGFSIDSQTLSEGLYILQVKGKNLSKNEKVMIVHQ